MIPLKTSSPLYFSISETLEILGSNNANGSAGEIVVHKKAFFSYCLNAQDPSIKEKLYQNLVPDSGKVYTQMAFPFLDKSRAGYVDFRNITGPVLVITGSEDKMTVSAIARKTAHNYKDSVLVSLTGADHMYPTGKFQGKTLSVIRAWLEEQEFI